MEKSRLVKAAPLEEFFRDKANSWAGTWSGPAYATALERVKAAPTVDAVEVVRCKDCEYCKDNKVCIRKVKSGNRHSIDRVHSNFYCAAGKRRGEE